MNEKLDSKTPATLATVKHGGCVQLRDWLPPLPAPAHEPVFECGPAYFDASQMRDYARTALSAQPSPATCKEGLQVQPSPGGQVGGLVESLVQVMNAQYDGLGYLPADVLGVLNMAVEALAARQPVYEGHTWISDYVLAGLRERAALPLQLRNGDVWHWQGDGHDFPESLACPVIMSAETLRALLAARQPVREPVAWMTHHDEPMLYPTFSEAAAYCDDDEPPIPLYAAPTAQAVDLGQFRDLIEFLIDRCDSDLTTEQFLLAGRLLNTIDSQA